MNRFRKEVFNLVLAAGLALCPGLASRAVADQAANGTAAQPPTQAQPQGQPQTQTPPPTQGQTPAPPAQPESPPAGVPAPGTGGTGPAAFGFSMIAPQAWTQATDTSTITVPGEVCCAWSPDGTATLVVFRQKPKGAVNPRALLNQSAKAFQTSLGASVDAQEVRDVGGMRAMWMIVTGKGNGAAIDGKGTVPTTQHWVAIPRSTDVLIFLLTAPQDKFATYEGALQQSLGAIQLSGTQTVGQKAAK
ncbi:MAG TPA: hypothetical protein VGR07_19675 [Thermoanaerobaculia bacterium]|jgi:hypothetical protein|nr:hypothetical protein [Thermoanaerobaculia bacterium]